MKKFVIAALALLAASSAAEARCKLFKGRLRHAVATVSAAPVKAVNAVGSCIGGACHR